MAVKCGLWLPQLRRRAAALYETTRRHNTQDYHRTVSLHPSPHYVLS
jgi:hypothetical protein